MRKHEKTIKNPWKTLKRSLKIHINPPKQGALKGIERGEAARPPTVAGRTGWGTCEIDCSPPS